MTRSGFQSQKNTLKTKLPTNTETIVTVTKPATSIFGIRMSKNLGDKEFTKVDLDYLVQSSIDNAQSDDDIEEEVRIFQNALDFSDTKVRDCMVPRTEIDAVEDTSTIEQLKQVFIESGHSKILVFHEDIDHVIGYIHSSDMFTVKDQQCVDLVREISFVPETMLASKLMKQLMQQKRSLAVVVDEFGGTSGLVSLEDIMEEITGEIEDEHDSTNYVAKQLDNGEYLLSARLEIEKVNELFSLELPESDEYMTVGGLILHEYQSFPKLNEVVKINQWEFKILKNTATKIELVRLKVNENSTFS